MSERLSARRTSSGINRNTLRLWGLIIIAAGALGRGILQNRVLQMGTVTTEELLATMDSSNAALKAATTALVLQAVESMAIPIFALLTVEGCLQTKQITKYLLRVTGMAVLSEIPFNLAMSGSVLDISSLNPAFGTVLVIAMIYLFDYVAATGRWRIPLRIVIFAAAWFWAGALRVEYGMTMVVVSAVLWAFRSRRTLSLFMGGAVVLCCSIGNPLFMFAPFGFLIASFCNGEEGESVRVLQYLLYPIVLALVAAAGFLLF